MLWLDDDRSGSLPGFDLDGLEGGEGEGRARDPGGVGDRDRAPFREQRVIEAGDSTAELALLGDVVVADVGVLSEFERLARVEACAGRIDDRLGATAQGVAGLEYDVIGD